jgi:heterodisulfide reductase subunit B
MCQMNLDAFQSQMNGYFKTNYHMPILFFTQLMGIAFGAEAKELGFGSEFVSARGAMSRIGVQTPEPTAETPAPAKKKPAGLPMPPPLVKKGKSTGTSKEARQ